MRIFNRKGNNIEAEDNESQNRDFDSNEFQSFDPEANSSFDSNEVAAFDPEGQNIDNDELRSFDNSDNDMNTKQNKNEDCEPMGVGRWIGSLILLNIPIVNIVFFCLWFFGKGNRNRVQYVRANFVVLLIKIIITAIIIIACMSTVLALFDQIVEWLNSSSSVLLPLLR